MLAGAAQSQTASEKTDEFPEYNAEIVRIIDGDTVEAAVDLWPGLVGHYSVRIRGLQAPELRGAGCEAEKEWALEAKAKAERLYDVGKVVLLKNVQYDAFSGRVLADVERWRSDRWLSFKDEMIAAEMGVEWTPDMEDVPWCLLAETRAN